MPTITPDTAPPARRWHWPDWPAGLREGPHGEMHYDRPRMSRKALEQAVIHTSDGGYNGLVRLSQLVRIGVVDLAEHRMAGITASTWLKARSRTTIVSYSTETRLSRERAVGLFRANTYTVNTRPAKRPTEPITLYRAAGDGTVALDHLGRHVAVDALGQSADPDTEVRESYSARCGLMWTRSERQARKWLADWGTYTGRRAVWETTVEPEFLLCQLGPEYVVDPAGLDLERIVPVGR